MKDGKRDSAWEMVVGGQREREKEAIDTETDRQADVGSADRPRERQIQRETHTQTYRSKKTYRQLLRSGDTDKRTDVS